MAIDAASMVGNLNNISNITFNADPFGKQAEKKVSGTFDEIYRAAVDALDKVSEYQFEADKLQTDYALGKTDDMLAVMLAQEKAYFALNFTVQVTNKIVTAYNEIMRIAI